MPVEIFISYSRRDSAFAHWLEAGLRDRGCSVWLDVEKLHTGQLWRQEIVQAIESCDFFVLVLSSRSIRSDNVVRELCLAEGSAKTILPVMLEPVEIPAKMKYQLAGLQIVLIEPERREQGLLDLLAALPLPGPAQPSQQSPAAPKTAEQPAAHEPWLWQKHKVLSELSLAIGPIAAYLLEPMPEVLHSSDRQALVSVFMAQDLDLEVLERALAAARIEAKAEAPDGQLGDDPRLAATAEWFRLQVGPIADLVWDAALVHALRQAPERARSRLEQIGVPAAVVQELLQRGEGELPVPPPCP